MSYYDIDDILADGEKVPCRFNLTVPGLGYLEGNLGKAVAKDTKLDLPMWLASVLAACAVLEDTDESFVDLLEPDFLGPQVMNAIKADACAVDLHSVMGHFYRLCEKWAAMFNDEKLALTAMDMLKKRALAIDNYAASSSKLVNSPFLQSLDEFEKSLYKATYESKRQMRAWDSS